MKPILSTLVAAIVLVNNVALGQYSDDSRWVELRRRISQGGDVEELLRQWKTPAQSRASTRSASTVVPTPARRPEWAGGLAEHAERTAQAACAAGVPPSMALAVLEHESGFDNRAVGGKGELGAGQILPTTADTFGFDRGRLAADFEYNVRSAVSIMRWLLDYFNGDETAAIKGYNGGPGWQTGSEYVRAKVEEYAAAVRQLRDKYVYVRCS